MSYDQSQHGAAEYNSWMHVPSGIVDGIVEGDPFPSGSSADEQRELLKRRKFAHLVYQVNSSSSSISGSIGINDSGSVSVSGDSLKVFDEEAHTKLDQIVINTAPEFPNTSTIVKYDGDFTYIMTAEPSNGTITSGSPVWQVSRIFDNGLEIYSQWADGNDNYDNAASGYLSLSYSF